MRKYIYTLLAAFAFLAVSPAFADFDPKAPLPVDPLLTQEQFDALLPLMDCTDMKNRDLVNQQQTVQQNFQNLGQFRGLLNSAKFPIFHSPFSIRLWYTIHRHANKAPFYRNERAFRLRKVNANRHALAGIP